MKLLRIPHKRGLIPAIYISVSAVALVVIFCNLYFGYLQPYRNPTSWDESEYLQSALIIRKLVTTSPGQFGQVLVDGGYFTFHRSLVASLFVVPLVAVLSPTYDAVYAASVLMTAVLLLLMVMTVRYLLGPGIASWVGSVFAAFVFVGAPMNMGMASMLMSEAPVAIMALVSFMAYLWARRQGGPGAFVIASLILFTCIYARAERALLFMVAMFAAYCLDEFKSRGWKDGVTGVLSFAGLGTISWLWCQDAWLGKTAATSPAALLCIPAVIALVFWFSWVSQPSPAQRRALSYGLPAALLMLLWLSTPYHANTVFGAIQLAKGKGVNLLERLVWNGFRFGYCGNDVAVCVNIALFLIGICLAALRWPGLLVMFLFYAVQLVRMPFPEVRIMYQMSLIFSIVAGLAGAKLCEMAVRALGRWTAKRWLAESLAALGLSAALLCIVLPGTFSRLWNLNPYYTPACLFDEDHCVDQALAVIEKRIPNASTYTIPESSINPTFSYQTIRAYAMMRGKEWNYVGWLRYWTNAVPVTAEYVVYLQPGVTNSPYFYNPADCEGLRERRAALEASAAFEQVVCESFGHGKLVLSLYRRKR